MKPSEAPYPVYRHTAKPHKGKTVYEVEEKKLKGLLQSVLERRQTQPMSERLANRFIVMVQWKKTVEEVSEMLTMHGHRHKAYHGTPTKKSDLRISPTTSQLGRTARPSCIMER